MSEAAEKLTPMMVQYRETKKEIPADAILFYRLGDFYEMFFEDAARASKLLGLTLTRRAGVPMCGFPYHALDSQLPKILKCNVKVAIAEQMEDPKLAKGLVKRQITRIITPGTVTENCALDPGSNNFLTALVCGKKSWALASLDLSTGEFRTTELADRNAVVAELERLKSPECVLPETLDGELNGEGKVALELRGRILYTPLEDDLFELSRAEEFLEKHFGTSTLDGFGCREHPLCVAAAGALLSYAVNNLRCDGRHITNLVVYFPEGFLGLDASTCRNLELVEPLYADGADKTLLGVLDRTSTPMGRRLLRQWILRPLCDRMAILRRLDAVESLRDDVLTLAELRESIGVVRDLERIVGRLNIGTANARDLQALASGLEILPGVRLLLDDKDAPLLADLRARIGEFPELTERIGATLAEDLPMSTSDGGIVRKGFSSELDMLRSAAGEGKNWIASIQAREVERTGIRSLKIKFNQVFGYFIEISRANLAGVPSDYIRKQTMANAERFITPELKELENKILGSEERSKILEAKIFADLRDYAATFTAAIQQASAALAELDVLISFAECASMRGYCRPKIETSDVLVIRNGRHPVLDLALQGSFVPNDVDMDCGDHRMMIITGPNMAGKSTYIRQVALLVIMAQIGSFLPADEAEIGLVDRVFTRVGAADDLARGQSTFMVEMVETANILNHATNRSLVILDEIGRGTSTYDGLSIAWSVAEFLHDDPMCRCRTLFATHYHELTELAQTRRGVNNFNVAVREYGDRVVFLRRIVPGGTDRSYGIHVAKLAGLPPSVIERAHSILESLEDGSDRTREAMLHVKVQAVKRRKSAGPGEDSDLFQPGLF
ncbi:MAG: DNA mismatch repair protein MutS [Victivallaceae bacterium]|nr:DNA mismatch repair protein MutS [Victivallaceae bacterium]